MIELHYIEIILLLSSWIVSMIVCYWLGVGKVLRDYQDALEKWGEALQNYKRLHSKYKKLLKDYKEQSKMYMN